MRRAQQHPVDYAEIAVELKTLRKIMLITKVSTSSVEKIHNFTQIASGKRNGSNKARDAFFIQNAYESGSIVAAWSQRHGHGIQKAMDSEEVEALS